MTTSNQAHWNAHRIRMAKLKAKSPKKLTAKQVRVTLKYIELTNKV